MKSTGQSALDASRYVELAATHFVPLQFPNRVSAELGDLIDRCTLERAQEGGDDRAHLRRPIQQTQVPALMDTLNLGSRHSARQNARIRGGHQRVSGAGDHQRLQS
jgi:hypothetical protein